MIINFITGIIWTVVITIDILEKLNKKIVHLKISLNVD